MSPAERERIKGVGYTATLPEGFQWGPDAMESFGFGAKQATEAILEALAPAEERCGLCRFWQLSGYGQGCFARGEAHGQESGAYGHHTDGSVSACRKSAPAPSGREEASLSGDAAWPMTKRTDWCGDFERRVRA